MSASLRTITSTVSSVSSSATSVTLLPSDITRVAFFLFNDSNQDCYVKFGTTASSSSFSLKMAAGSFYESGYPGYSGRIDAIWASANGAMRVTEVR